MFRLCGRNRHDRTSAGGTVVGHTPTGTKINRKQASPTRCHRGSAGLRQAKVSPGRREAPIPLARRCGRDHTFSRQRIVQSLCSMKGLCCISWHECVRLEWSLCCVSGLCCSVLSQLKRHDELLAICELKRHDFASDVSAICAVSSEAT